MTTEVSVQHQAATGERDSRQTRAEVLFETAAFERISKTPEVWIMETVYGAVYRMEWDRMTCECQDYERHYHLERFRCEHLIALTKKRAWFKKNVWELVGFGVVGDDAA